MVRSLPPAFRELETKSKFKILFYLLGGVSLILLIVVVILFLGIWLPAKKYISDTPFKIEHIPKSLQQEKFVQQKLTQFLNQSSIDTLLLSEMDINHLIRTNSVVKDYNVNYRIRFHDSLINVRCVVPIQKIRQDIKSLAKYMNVNGYLNAELEGYFKVKGEKIIFVSTNSQMNGLPAPFALLGKRTHIDVATYFPNRFQYERVRKQFNKIKIANDHLMLIRN